MPPSEGFAAIILALVCCFYSLVGVWAAFSSLHWSARLAILCAAISVLLVLPVPHNSYFNSPVATPDVATKFLPFFCASASVFPFVLILLGWRACRTGGFLEHTRFRLYDLLLLLTFVCVFLGVCIRIPRAALPPNLRVFLTLAAYLTTAALLGIWTFVGRRSFWFRLTTGFLAWFALAVAVYYGFVRLDSRVFTAGCIQYVIVGSYVYLWRLCGRPHEARRLRGLSSRAVAWMPEVSRCALVLGIAIPVGLLFCELVKPLAIPSVKVPIPNGYDILVCAGKSTTSWELFSENMTAEQLRRFVENNRRAYELGSTAVDVPSLVTLPFDVDASSAIRHYCRAELLRAQLASERGDSAESLHVLLTLLRITRQSETGGRIIHRLVADDVQKRVFRSLQRLVDGLSTDECRLAVAALLRHDREREPLSAASCRSGILDGLEGGWVGRMDTLISSAERDLRRRNIQIDNRNRGATRVLACELAFRVFWAETGRLPSSLTDLVPRYLPELPRDPFDQLPMKFKRHLSGYAIYCVGPNGRDDGGVDDKDHGDCPVLERLSDTDLRLWPVWSD